MAMKANDLVRISEAQKQSEEAAKRFGAMVNAIVAQEREIIRLDVKSDAKHSDLWNTGYKPLIQAAMEDDSLTQTAWDSLLTVHLDQAIEKALAKTGSKLSATLKSYHSTVRVAPGMLKSEWAETYYTAQAAKAKELAAKGKAEEAAKVADQKPLNLEEASYNDLRRVISNATKTARNPVEIDVADAVAEVTKTVKAFAKVLGQNAKTVKAIKAINAEMVKAIKAAEAAKGKAAGEGEEGEEGETPLTDATQDGGATPIRQAA